MQKFSLFILCTIFLVSCGQEVTPSTPSPVPPVKTEAPAPVSEVQSGSASVESNSWISIIDNLKEFNLDDYLLKWTYSIVQKFEKWTYEVLVIDPVNNSLSIYSKWNITDANNWFSCIWNWSVWCVIFVLKNNKVFFTNLATKWKFLEWKSLSDDIGWVYKIADKWVIFANYGWNGTIDEWILSSWVTYTFTYLNLSNLNTIYEDYIESTSCKADNSNKCIISTKKVTTSKEFFDLPKWDSNRKKLNLKAKNLEDAYFEYYKEKTSGDAENNVSFSDTQIQDILVKIDANTKKQQEIAKNASGVLIQGNYRAEYFPSKDNVDDKVKITANWKESFINLDEINIYNKKVNDLNNKWVCSKKNYDTPECIKISFWNFYNFYKDWKYLWYTTSWYEVGSLTLISINDWKKIISIFDSSDCHDYLNDQYLICQYYRGDGEIWIINTSIWKENKVWSNVSWSYLDDSYIYTKEGEILKIYSLITLEEVFSKEIK